MLQGTNNFGDRSYLYKIEHLVILISPDKFTIYRVLYFEPAGIIPQLCY